MKSFAITTLGCKVNQFDGQVIIEKLKKECGYAQVLFDEKADIYVINTCTVTNSSDVETRKLIRRAKRLNPDAKVVVTGCYAQVNSEEVLKISGVDIVLGNEEKLKKLPEYLSGNKQVIVKSYAEKPVDTFSLVADFSYHSRAFFKIQDGCNSRCSYCIVPYARGASRSLDLPEVLKQIAVFRRKGFKEIVLTGVHLGSYGIDIGRGKDLFTLLSEIEDKYDDIRIRLSSIEPEDVKDEWIKQLSKSKIVCEYLHLPLQSGSNTVLKRMKRRYSVERYREIVLMYNELLPEGALGTDLITGFPGESISDFEETYSFAYEMPFSYFHVFPFSKRKGTDAFDFDGEVDAKTIKERAKVLREAGMIKKNAFAGRFTGRKLKAIKESYDKSSCMSAMMSRNYLRIKVPSDFKNASEPVVLVEECRKGELFGRVID